MVNRIYIDLTAYSPTYKGGVSTYVQGLVNGFAGIDHDARIFLIVFDMEQIPTLTISDPRMTVIHIKQFSPKLVKFLHKVNYRLFRSEYLLTIIQILLHKNIYRILVSKPGIVYCPTTYANFPVLRSKLVVSLHDIQEQRFPEFFTKSQRIYRALNVRNTLRAASHIQVSSFFVFEEIKRYYENKSLKNVFVVISEGVELREDELKIGFGDKSQCNTLVLPASFHPHKNQEILLNVIQNLTSPVKICLTGDVSIHRKFQDFMNMAEKYDFHLLGFLTEEQLRSLYSDSSIVLSTSLYESSSLPLLEGISYGCIPIASDIPAHREMAKNFKMFLFDPMMPNQLIEKIDEVSRLSSEDKKHIQEWNGRALEQYSWKDIAGKYLDLFSSI